MSYLPDAADRYDTWNDATSLYLETPDRMAELPEEVIQAEIDSAWAEYECKREEEENPMQGSNTLTAAKTDLARNVRTIMRAVDHGTIVIVEEYKEPIAAIVPLQWYKRAQEVLSDGCSL
jgi:hypothetical protein